MSCIKGVDLKLHDEVENYREVVNFIKNDANSVGALVTTHKIDLLKACRDLLRGIGLLCAAHRRNQLHFKT